MTRQHMPRGTRSGPPAYWAAMRKLTSRNGSFSVSDVARKAPDAARNTVTCYVAACRRAGLVEIVGDRRVHRGREKLYAVKVTRPEPPFEKEPPTRSVVRAGAVQMHLWTAMRGMTSWTSQDLALAASTDDLAIAPAVARKYAAALRRAGYVQEIEPARSRHHGRYRLRPSMNTGPNPPVLHEDGRITDRNRPARRS